MLYDKTEIRLSLEESNARSEQLRREEEQKREEEEKMIQEEKQRRIEEGLPDIENEYTIEEKHEFERFKTGSIAIPYIIAESMSGGKHLLKYILATLTILIDYIFDDIRTSKNTGFNPMLFYISQFCDVSIEELTDFFGPDDIVIINKINDFLRENIDAIEIEYQTTKFMDIYNKKLITDLKELITDPENIQIYESMMEKLILKAADKLERDRKALEKRYGIVHKPSEFSDFI